MKGRSLAVLVVCYLVITGQSTASDSVVSPCPECELELYFGDFGRQPVNLRQISNLWSILANDDGGYSILGNSNLTPSVIEFEPGGKPVLYRSFPYLVDTTWEAAYRLADGKWALAGRGYADDFIVARLLEDLTFDTSFNETGWFVEDIGGPISSPGAVAVTTQNDGKILAIFRQRFSTDYWIIVRYLATGGLDTSFGGDGIVELDFGALQNSFQKIIPLSDGRVVVCGQSTVTAFEFYPAAARLLANGNPDTAFNSDGKVILDNIVAFFRDCELQSDGKLLIATDYSLSNYLTRLDTDGSIDTGFATDGMYTGDGTLRRIRVLSNGHILTGGSAPGVTGLRLTRMDSSGAPVSGFGQGGVLTITFSPEEPGSFLDFAIDSAGDLITVGSMNRPYNTYDDYSQQFVTRHDASGILNPWFGNFGRKTIPQGAQHEAQAVRLSPTGSIFVAGLTALEEYGALMFSRTLLDAAGQIEANTATSQLLSGYSLSMKVLSDGKTYAWGGANSPTDFYVSRFLSTAQLDSGFGGGGEVTLDFGSFDSAHALAVQADGKVVVAGDTGNSTSNKAFALARLLENGLPDAAFGVDGKVVTPMEGMGSWAREVAIQSDGKILVAGQVSPDVSTVYLAIRRYLTDGTLDTSFGDAGLILYDNELSGARGIAILPNGKIIVLGTWNLNTIVACYFSNGTPDPTFGVGGVTQIAGEYTQLSVSPDQFIYIAGNTVAGWNLRRLNSSGVPDPDFGPDGSVSVEFFGLGSTIGGIQALEDGSVLLFGVAWNGHEESTDLAIARTRKQQLFKDGFEYRIQIPVSQPEGR